MSYQTTSKTLYHYTCRYHLASIFNSGELRLTESNIGSPNPHWKPFGEHYGPDVVWLTDVSNLNRGHGLEGGLVNKFAIRFMVTADAVAWSTFAASHGINKKWYRALSDGSQKHWWVSAATIPASSWLEVWDMEQDVLLHRAGIAPLSRVA